MARRTPYHSPITGDRPTESQLVRDQLVHVATLGPTVESRVLWDRLASTTAKGLLS
jgi:hypothetical protein